MPLKLYLLYTLYIFFTTKSSTFWKSIEKRVYISVLWNFFQKQPPVIYSGSLLIEDLSIFLKGTGAVGLFWKPAKKNYFYRFYQKIYQQTTSAVVCQKGNSECKPMASLLRSRSSTYMSQM